MARFMNTSGMPLELPGDGERPSLTVLPGDVIEADKNPNLAFFEPVKTKAAKE